MKILVKIIAVSGIVFMFSGCYTTAQNGLNAGVCVNPQCTCPKPCTCGSTCGCGKGNNPTNLNAK